MTANDTTPEKGQDSTELEREGFPLNEATNEEIALALEEEKQKVRSAADDVSRALLNEDVPLTGDMVERLWSASGAVTALSRTLSLRVPKAHRIEESESDTDC
jgi:ATP-dependent exoDNAse (exonuclease V) beta subunit